MANRSYDDNLTTSAASTPIDIPKRRFPVIESLGYGTPIELFPICNVPTADGQQPIAHDQTVSDIDKSTANQSLIPRSIQEQSTPAFDDGRTTDWPFCAPPICKRDTSTARLTAKRCADTGMICLSSQNKHRSRSLLASKEYSRCCETAISHAKVEALGLLRPLASRTLQARNPAGVQETVVLPADVSLLGR